MIIVHTICPYCLVKHDRMTGLKDGDVPESGDFSMCFSCGRFNVFEIGEMEPYLRKPMPCELRHIASDPDCRAAMAAWLTA